MANVSLAITGMTYDTYKVLHALIEMGLQLVDVNSRDLSSWYGNIVEARFELDENTMLHIIITGKIEEGAHLEVTTKEKYITFAGKPTTATCVKVSEFMPEKGVEDIIDRILDVLTD